MTEETLLKFPCDFPIKITGKNNPEFKNSVLELIDKNIPKNDFIALKENTSSKGNYLALTLNARFHDKKSLDEIYIKLGKLKEVLMVL